MAASRLTLSLDPETIKRAKQIARERETSVSQLFSDFVGELSPNKKSGSGDLPPLTKKMRGVLRDLDAEGKSYDDILTEALLEKYGLK